VPRCSHSLLTYTLTLDAEGNACPRLLCGSCARTITDGSSAAVQAQPFVRLVCGGCIPSLDADAELSPLAAFLVTVTRNAGLGHLFRDDVDEDLIPVA
jgi:hypothetical protein